jgi:hypothetical protein
MTKDELLKKLLATESFEAAVNDIITYVKSVKGTLDANLTEVSGKVTTLIGSDAAKSVRTIANEELASQLIPASAKESLDTLQEIAAWIQQHPDDAAAMNTAITNLQNLVGTLPAETTATTVVGFITAEVAAIRQELEGKNVDAEGDAYFGLTAANNKVTGAATQKTIDAIALAETSVQPDDLDLLTVAEAKAIVAAAIAAE